jgi:hypothetical protein
MSTVRCFACGEMRHYVQQCPKKKRKKQDGMAATTKEEEFASQFERECAFIGCCLSVETPSSGWCADKVEEVPQIENVVTHGDGDSIFEDIIFRGDSSTRDNFSFRIVEQTNNWCRGFRASEIDE